MCLHRAESDLWRRLEIHPVDEIHCYAYILFCVNDIFCIHCNAETVLECLHWSFPLKPGYGNPDLYLGAKLQKTSLHN